MTIYNPSEACGFEEIRAFRSPGEFKSFVEYLDRKVQKGIAAEIPPDPTYSKGQLRGGRWFECIKDKTIWRLLKPDFPFKGLWEVVELFTTNQQEQAGEIALALEWGYADASEAVTWMDSIIENSKTINNDMIKVSLSKDVATAITHLHEISKNSDEWNILRLFLRRFNDVTVMSFESASKLAKHLYMKSSYDDEAPSDMNCFASHWDAIDLAVDGVTGDPKVAVKNFLDDIREFANK